MAEDKGIQLLKVLREMRTTSSIYHRYQLEIESEKLQRMIGRENKRKLSEKTLEKREC